MESGAQHKQMSNVSAYESEDSGDKSLVKGTNVVLAVHIKLWQCWKVKKRGGVLKPPPKAVSSAKNYH